MRFHRNLPISKSLMLPASFPLLSRVSLPLLLSSRHLLCLKLKWRLMAVDETLNDFVMFSEHLRWKTYG